MNPINEATRVVRNQDVPSGEVDGEFVALDIDRGQCFGMDRVGSAIWAMAEAPVTIGEIASHLTETHEVDREQCLADIVPFIEELLSEKLLRQLDG